MTQTTIENCKITSTMLGIEDHGILTCYLHLDGNGWGVIFGGYGFGSGPKDSREFVSMEVIEKILKTLEVDSWEDLKGQLVRVEKTGWGEPIHKIGHIVKDQWFSLKEYFDGEEG